MTGGPLRATCPGCRFSGEMMLFLDGPEYAEFTRYLIRTTRETQKILPRYLHLFGANGRAIQIAKAARITRELAAITDAGKLRRDHRDVPVPSNLLLHGLQAVLDNAAHGKVKLPLKDNGYLFGILANMSDSLGREEERTHEERLRAGRRETPPAPTPPPPASAAARAATAARHLGPLKERFGIGQARS